MDITNGIYRLASGDGGGFLVEVRDGKIYPMDTGGPVQGLIQVHDRTFLLNKTDNPIELERDGYLKHNEKSYSFTVSDAYG